MGLNVEDLLYYRIHKVGNKFAIINLVLADQSSNFAHSIPVFASRIEVDFWKYVLLLKLLATNLVALNYYININ